MVGAAVRQTLGKVVCNEIFTTVQGVAEPVTGHSLVGRGFVVTGGAGHLGSEMVKVLLSSGAVVVAVARSADSLAALTESSGRERERLETLALDVRSDDVVSRAAELLEARDHPLSGWVNNANTVRGGGLLFNLSRDELAESIQSLTELIIITDQIAAKMVHSQAGGSIVNISSMYGLVAPDPRTYAADPSFRNPPAYGVVKAGMLQFTRYAAVHLASFGIRVNAVSPGPFPSPQVQTSTTFIEELEKRVPLGRIGRAKEVAGAVEYLLSDASSYTTGANIVVDGGWTAW